MVAVAGSTCEPGGVNWNIDTLASGASVSFSLSPTILGILSPGQVLFLDAEVVDGNGGSSSASQSVLVGIFADGYGNVCDADFNNNLIVDPLDFSLLKLVLGSPSAPNQDLNGNGIVDPLDFSS